MYAGYFGLNQAPFSIAPDPRYLFMSERHREALAHLLYGLEGGGGFVLLTGEIGTGKTTIGRCFLQQLPPHCSVAYIFNPKLSALELLQTICHEFQVQVPVPGDHPPSINDFLDPLNAYLLHSHASGRHNLLLIDEAQNLSADVLEQLRLLTNLETSERKLLQIVLMGQPELRELLARPELEQLAQRVVARFHLGALSALETQAYIQHRLGVAGLQGPLPFAPAALKRIHKLSAGVPRRINLLCDRALLGAYARGLMRVDSGVVNQAAQEVFDTPAKPALGRSGWKFAPLALGLLLGGTATATWLLGAPGWSGWRSSANPPLALESRPPAITGSAPTGIQPTASDAVAEPETSPLLVGALPPASALMNSEATAVQQLGALWNQPLGLEDPCTAALGARLQCFRTPRMTLHGLRQLDRPAVLMLRLPGPSRGWVLLSHIDSETATLQNGPQRWRVPLTVLADAWRGDYTTLWRQPAGQVGYLRRGNSGPASEWVAQQLQGLQPDSPRGVDPGSSALADAVTAFQVSQGLEADGVVGALTFMQLNRHSGVPEPRLATTQR
jgi:general secretion pathway protein A